MVTLYSLTIYIDLALLAIVIAIFVFASSIHGGASKISAEEEETHLARRRERIEEAKEELLGEQFKSVDSAHFVEELRAKIAKLENDLKNIDRSILEVRKKGKALTVRTMVTIPSLFLVISVITSGIAIITSGILPTILWALSLILAAISLYFIYRNLVIVESFSSLMDLSTALEQALERHETKLKPVTDIEKNLKKDVATILISLPPQEARIIQMSYGIDHDQMSLEDIAKEFGVTRETIRMRLARALRMSRHPSRSRRFKYYLDSIPVMGKLTGEQLFLKAVFGIEG
jgi:RNA polymerase sigma factor (sigma-70 family)